MQVLLIVLSAVVGILVIFSPFIQDSAYEGRRRRAAEKRMNHALLDEVERTPPHRVIKRPSVRQSPEAIYSASFYARKLGTPLGIFGLLSLPFWVLCWITNAYFVSQQLAVFRTSDFVLAVAVLFGQEVEISFFMLIASFLSLSEAIGGAIIAISILDRSISEPNTPRRKRPPSTTAFAFAYVLCFVLVCVSIAILRGYRSGGPGMALINGAIQVGVSLQEIVFGGITIRSLVLLFCAVVFGLLAKPIRWLMDLRKAKSEAGADLKAKEIVFNPAKPRQVKLVTFWQGIAMGLTTLLPPPPAEESPVELSHEMEVVP